MLQINAILEAIVLSAFTTLSPSPSEPIDLQEQEGPTTETVVIVGKRLRATKIDYRLDRVRVTYCGPRDKLQDPSYVRIICKFVEDCVFDGRRKLPELQQCVDNKMAQRDTDPGE